MKDIDRELRAGLVKAQEAVERCEARSSAAHGSAHLTVADPKRVPQEVAVCPECGGGLWWQVTTSDGLRDLDVDCEYEEEMGGDTEHRSWQSEWQPVLDAVRRWLGSGGSAPNDARISDESPRKKL